MGGDFNAHNTAWGYSHSNGRGRLLLEHAAAKRLVINNIVASLATYFTSSGIGSWPDVTLSSNADDPLVTDWEVLDDITGSDHRYISFTIRGSVVRQKSKRFKTKTRNLNNFSARLRSKRNELNSLFRDITRREQLEEELEVFYNIIM